MKAPKEVADAIRTGAISKIFVAGDTTRYYRGILKVSAIWGKYTRTVGAWRINREDAIQDAERVKADWVAVNGLPN